jgi:AraC-like DNA-binding protein
MSKRCDHAHEPVGQFGQAAEFFKMLGDETRIKIFWILCHSEECGVGLAERLGISSPAAAHHLRILRECGLIDSRRDGKEVYYRLADSETAVRMHSAVESIMEISCPSDSLGATSAETVRKVHDYLVEHLSERVTIEELSRMFHINATTLKEAFKTEYGTSLAAHIKEHRMEKAATLLRESGMSVAEIAKIVGFESRSRFTSAFKERYGVLPSEYRSSLCSQ